MQCLAWDPTWQCKVNFRQITAWCSNELRYPFASRDPRGHRQALESCLLLLLQWDWEKKNGKRNLHALQWPLGWQAAIIQSACHNEPLLTVSLYSGICKRTIDVHCSIISWRCLTVYRTRRLLQAWMTDCFVQTPVTRHCDGRNHLTQNVLISLYADNPQNVCTCQLKAFF